MAKRNSNSSVISVEEENIDLMDFDTDKVDGDDDDSVDYRKFGNIISHECEIDLNLFGKDNYTTYFYQMYLKKGDNDFQIIPVDITNKNDRILYKRFFLMYHFENQIDPESGLYFYAGEITFEAQLNNSNPESLSFMKIPRLKITYNFVREEQKEDEPIRTFTFISHYYMDLSFIMKWITALLVFALF